MTKLREMLRQSPLPNLARPIRNSLCSSSVQGMPFRRSCSDALDFCSQQKFLNNVKFDLYMPAPKDTS